MFDLLRKRTKAQILHVHGGMTFSKRKEYLEYLEQKTFSLEQKKSWPAWLQKKLSKQAQLVFAKMPCKENADYESWKIYFENYLEQIDKPLILIGNSLGGIFLAQYLAENKLKKKAHAVYLVAPPFDDSLPGEELTNGFKLPKSLSLLEKNTKKLTLYFSQNDEVVPISQAKKYEQALKNPLIHILDVPGHFFIENFPELLAEIKKDLREL